MTKKPFFYLTSIILFCLFSLIVNFHAEAQISFGKTTPSTITDPLPTITWCAPPASSGSAEDAFRFRIFNTQGKPVFRGGDYIRYTCVAKCSGAACETVNQPDNLTYRYFTVDGMAGVLRYNKSVDGKPKHTTIGITGGYFTGWPDWRGYTMDHFRGLGVRTVEFHFLEGIAPDALAVGGTIENLRVGVYSRTSAQPSTFTKIYARSAAVMQWSIKNLADPGMRVTTVGCSGGSQHTAAASILLGLAPQIDYQFFCGGPKIYDHRFTCRNAPGHEDYAKLGDMGTGQRLLIDYIHNVKDECAKTKDNPTGVDNLSPRVSEALHAASFVSIETPPDSSPTLEYLLNVLFDKSGKPLSLEGLPLDAGILIEGDNARHGIVAHVAYDLAHEQVQTPELFFDFTGKQSIYGDSSGKMNVRAILGGNLYIQPGRHCANMHIGCKKTAAFLGLPDSSCEVGN